VVCLRAKRLVKCLCSCKEFIWKRKHFTRIIKYQNIIVEFH